MTDVPVSPAPLLDDWTTPFGLPPFAEIAEAQYRPAFDAALERSTEAHRAIAEDPAAPSFANTIEAMERADRPLSQVASVFFNLLSAQATDGLEAIQREVAPVLAAHRAALLTDAKLFARVDALFAQRADLGLTSEQDRVLELAHRAFVRAGARLDAAGRVRMGEIMARLASLGAAFSQNVLADEKAWELRLADEADLDGLPPDLRAAAAETARARGHADGWVITLSRSLVEPFLQFSTRRDLREQAYRAWTSRGANGGETDTSAIIAETLALRAERARLLGFDTFADFKLAPEMAETPAAVRGLLMKVWPAAKARAAAEAEKLSNLMRAEGLNGDLAPWDWRYYAEKQRKLEHDFDESEIKPYLQLDNVVAAAFDVATRLFGLSFRPLADVPVPHPDVRAWEVTDRDGRHLGVFLGDYFARTGKRSGAWMSTFRDQTKLDGDVRPIVVNVMNFAKAPAGAPSLLTFDDARTLFHEFGHGLHGLMSNVGYAAISGTSVARDFVELPSQLYEHWLSAPEVLDRHARRAETGAAMPTALRDKLIAAETFNQGFATVEYTASALVDLALHAAVEPPADPVAFEAATLAEIGMPAAIGMRHRTPHFAHVFSGDGYSAGYYSYLWSEVMDADAFQAFEQTGDVFHAETAAKLAEHVYSAGGRQEPNAAYEAFRGAQPSVDALLAQRGLAEYAPRP